MIVSPSTSTTAMTASLEAKVGFGGYVEGVGGRHAVGRGEMRVRLVGISCASVQDGLNVDADTGIELGRVIDALESRDAAGDDAVRAGDRGRRVIAAIFAERESDLGVLDGDPAVRAGVVDGGT